MRPVQFPVQFRWLGLLLALSLLVPFATAMAEKEMEKPAHRAAPGALTLPLAGTVVDAANQAVGRFSGSVTINRFANQNDHIVAIGIASGTVTDLAGRVVKSGLQTVVLPVNRIGNLSTVGLPIPPSTEPRLMQVSFTKTTSGQFILAQAQSCGILHLAIGGNSLNLLGFIVNLSPITLDISGDSAGPLGALVCQVLALLGTVADVVGLLNSILGLLTGLLGGLTGA